MYRVRVSFPFTAALHVLPPQQPTALIFDLGGLNFWPQNEAFLRLEKRGISRYTLPYGSL